MKLALVYVGSGIFTGIPLGLVFLASYLRNQGYEVDIVDSNWCDPVSTVLRGNYTAIGISSMTPQYEKATRIAKIIRIGTRAPIIIGGVHISTLPKSLRPCFDIGIVGEGEESMIELITNGFNARGIIERHAPLDLTKYPDLDFNLIDHRYFKKQANRLWQDVVSESLLITSRGCPYKCAFCSTTKFWTRYRAHPVDWCIRQIEHLVDLGVTHLQICDDLFTVHKKRTADFVEAFRSAGLHKHIKGVGCAARTNLADEELCELLKKLNVKIVSFGFESGNDRMLRYLKADSTNVAKNKLAVKTCRKHNFRVVGSLMVGSPTETVQEMLDTASFIQWSWFNGVEDLWPFTSAPYPDTQFWEIGKERGVVTDDMNFDNCSANLKNPGRPLLLEPTISLNTFRLVWFWIQLNLLPLKVKKLVRLVIRILSTHINFGGSKPPIDGAAVPPQQVTPNGLHN